MITRRGFIVGAASLAVAPLEPVQTAIPRGVPVRAELIYDIRVVGADSVRRAFASIERRFTEHMRRCRQARQHAETERAFDAWMERLEGRT